MADATLADLFGSNLLMHYMADGASKLFTDTGGTVAANDGDAIKCWKPESDAAWQVNLTETTNGPAYRANYASSGYKALEFDGSNDVLSNSAPGFSTSQRCHILAAVTPIGASNTLWHRGSSASHYYRALIATTTMGSAGSGGTGPTASSLTNAKRVAAYAFHSDCTEVNCYGRSAGNNSDMLTASVSAWFVLGAFNTGTPSFSQFGNFALHEIVVVHDDVEWGQVIRGATILRNKWGVADQNSLPQAVAAGSLNPITSVYGKV